MRFSIASPIRKASMDEFGIIRQYFAPLANHEAALNLIDDAACLSLPPGQELVITTDALCEGVHFLGSETPDLIARKGLRCNLSDLAAKGAKPLGYFLTLQLPTAPTQSFLQSFTRGLSKDQNAFGFSLLGGDSAKSRKDFIFSITALGSVPKGSMLKRSSAKPGDDVYVSGTLGDSAIGLALLKKKQRFTAQERFLTERYLIPEPRLALGLALQGIATSCMDISDGLLQDAGHIAAASSVCVQINMPSIPLSEEAVHYLKTHPALRKLPLHGGDDYELLFTAPPGRAEKVRQAATKSRTQVTRIGRVMPGKGAVLLDAAGKPVRIKHKGWQHF